MTKQEYFNRDNSYYFFDQEEKIASYCYQYFNEDVRHIIKVADDVSNHSFLFDLKWDMERTYHPIYFEDKIDWEIIPNKDPEFVWQFNRHRFFICLGQAYLLTKDEKYAKAFVSLLLDWITNMTHTKERENLSWRSLEVGLRGAYWTKAMRYFKDSKEITDEVIHIFHNSLLEHAQYLVSKHTEHKYLSNWGVLENHGLFEIAIALPDPEKREYYINIALDCLEKAARIQILPDGVQWEQSPMYHNEVFQCYMDVLILARRNKIHIPDIIVKQVRKMAYVNLHWVKPNGCQVMNGDSDDTNIRDMLTLGAWYFQDPVLKSGGDIRLGFEEIWNLGIQGMIEYEQLSSSMPTFLSTQLNSSGNYYFRSDWSDKANFMHFHCGSLGGGHGHADQLHVDLVLDGRDILVDAGRYTYVVELGRFRLKEANAHNTITMNQQPFTVCNDAWGYHKIAKTIHASFSTTDLYDFVQGGHLGYLQQRIYINRKVVYIKPDIFFIMDEVYGEGNPCLEEYFHFNEAGSIQVEKNCVNYVDEVGKVVLLFLSEDITLEKKNSCISRHYNEMTRNDALVVKKMHQNVTTFITVIGKDGIQAEKLDVFSATRHCKLEQAVAEAVKINYQDKSYIIVCCHQDQSTAMELFEVDSCIGFGKVVVFDLNQYIVGGEVLES